MIIKITEKKSLDITSLGSKSLSLKLNNIKALESRTYYEEFGNTFYTQTITKLKFEGKEPYIIKLGDEIVVDKVKYVITKIICGEKDDYILITEELNKSAKYLLPLILPKGSTATGYLFNICLFNTYLYCNKYPEMSNGKFLFLKYRFFDNDQYKKLEDIIINQNNFVLIDDSEKGFTTFALDIGEKFNITMHHFLSGKYHMFSPECEDRILRFLSPITSGKSYTRLHHEVKQVLKRDEGKIKQLEKALGMELPEGIGLDSKPKRINETLIL